MWNNCSLTCLTAWLSRENDLTRQDTISDLSCWRSVMLNLGLTHPDRRVAWQIRNRDLNAPSAPVRAQETLNKDPLGGLTGPEFCRPGELTMTIVRSMWFTTWYQPAMYTSHTVHP